MSGNNELLFCFEKMCRIPGIFGPIEAMIGSILVYWYRLVILVRFMHAKEVIFFAWLPNLDLGSLKSPEKYRFILEDIQKNIKD